jgi:ABC-type metal ion transport system substrate-binding protein
MPVFMASHIYNQEKATNTLHKQDLIKYQQSVLVAFGEVENNPMGQSKTLEIMEIQAAQVASLRSHRGLAVPQYKNG